MNSPTVYLPIEIVAREMWAKALLALELARLGCDVVIGHKGHVLKYALLQQSPGLYLNKSVGTTNNLEYYEKLKANGIRLFAQDEEHGATLRDYRDFFVSRKGLADIGVLDGFLCWGLNDYKFLQQMFPDFSQQLHMTGSPRVALWGDSGKLLLNEQIKSLRQTHSEYTLLATNFPLANSVLRSKALSKLRSQFSTNVDTFEDKFRFRLHAEKQHLAKTLELVAQFQKRGERLVLRPHPTENPRFWQEVTRQMPHIIVDCASYSSALVLGASSVIHSNSTLGFEAVASKVRSFSFTSTSLEDIYASHIVNSVSPSFSEPSSYFETNIDWSTEEQRIGQQITANRFHSAGTLESVNAIAKLILREFSLPLSDSYPEITSNILLTLLRETRIYRLLTQSKLTRVKQSRINRFLLDDVLYHLSKSRGGLRLQVNQVGPSTFKLRRYLGSF
jgi:surface carbohydrate biosynthesis protein